MNNEEKQEELKVAISDFIWEYELGKIGFGECVNKFSQFILLDREKQKQRMKEKIKGMGKRRLDSPRSFGDDEVVNVAPGYNQALDDILALLEE